MGGRYRCVSIASSRANQGGVLKEARRIRAREDAGAWAGGDGDGEGQCGRVDSARSHRRRRAAQRESVREG